MISFNIGEIVNKMDWLCDYDAHQAIFRVTILTLGVLPLNCYLLIIFFEDMQLEASRRNFSIKMFYRAEEC